MRSERPLVVMMGVSGSGKTSVGTVLARRLGVEFTEGDRLHPQANIDKMSASIPLTDDDRWPWLGRVATALGDAFASGRGAVVSCSALKASYRDRLRQGAPGVLFAYLSGSPWLLRERMMHRVDHFMAPQMLDSQLAALEPPLHESDVVAFDIALPIETMAAQIEAAWRDRGTLTDAAVAQTSAPVNENTVRGRCDGKD